MSDTLQLPDVEPHVPLEELDAAVATVLVPLAEKEAVKALGEVSDFSDQEPIYAGAAAFLTVAAVMRDGPTWRAGTRIIAAHLFATALKKVIKSVVDRTRPDAAAKLGRYVFREGQRKDSDYSSFPSGHTAGALAVALAAGRDYPGGRRPALGLATAASVAQVIRSKHYVSDVVVGAAIGWGAEVVIDRLIGRAARY
jgi:membrane-associated phospholipid phosphatase